VVQRDVAPGDIAQPDVAGVMSASVTWSNVTSGGRFGPRVIRKKPVRTAVLDLLGDVALELLHKGLDLLRGA
jgi:hypothetical protein